MAQNQGTGGFDINIPDLSNSGDDYLTNVKLLVLTQLNWYNWKAKFENLL